MTTLQIRSLEKQFGSAEVLRGVELEVPASSITAVLGPSGCGKTTLLRLIAGFDRPDSGSIHIGDQVVFDERNWIPPQRRGVGFVAQEGALFPYLDVRHNIAFGLPGRTKAVWKRVDELLEFVGLDSGKANQYPHELSGGQQQRVAVARALAPNPRVVVLDEPFSALDATLRESTGQSVMQALRDANATAILVTHDQDEALSLADNVALMHGGRILQSASPTEIYRRPVDETVAQFVGAAIIVPGVAKNGRVRTIFGESPLLDQSTSSTAAQDSVTVMIRPEQVRLVEANSAPKALVTEVRYYGHDAAVRLQIDQSLSITARVLGEGVPGAGDTVGISIDGPVHLIESR